MLVLVQDCFKLWSSSWIEWVSSIWRLYFVDTLPASGAIKFYAGCFHSSAVPLRGFLPLYGVGRWFVGARMCFQVAPSAQKGDCRR